VDSEGTTLRLARAGDLTAFNELVRAHQGLVYGLCLRMLGQRAAAEDATQVTFLTAWQNVARLRGDRFRPWVLRIAASVCMDEFRRRGRRPVASLDASLEAGMPDPPDPSPSPESASLGSELRGRIEAALLALPAEQRLAVVLCDVQGLDYQEAARAMRTSLGTVKSRLSRARARLREVLLREPELLPGRLRPGSGGDET